MTISLTGSGVFTNIPDFPPNSALITPNDDEDFEHPVRVRCGSAGAVTFISYGNRETQTWDVVAGEVISCQVIRVLATGTDEITLHALY